MAIDFPTSPALNDVYTYSGKSWKWNGTAWQLQTSSGSSYPAAVTTFLNTPTSSNLAAAVSDETGTGSLVFSTSPSLTTPALGTPASGNLANCTFPTLNQSTTGNAATATTSTNLASGSLGSVPYQSAANTTLMVSPNTTTTKKVLTETGNGTVGAAPVWDTVTKSDVGLGSVENTALSTWTGSTNVTTLGTVGTGTWNATTIGLSKGGTNAALTAVNGGVAYSTASALALTAAGTSGQILKSNGASAPTWMSTSSITSVGTLSGLTITETNAADNTLVINAASAQTGNLIYVKDATAADLFVVDGTGSVFAGYITSSGLTVNGLIYPASDGTSGQLLSTNGSGTLSWATVSGASPAGSTGDIQYNDGTGNFTATSYFSYGSSAYDKLAIYSTIDTDNVVGIFAASGQTGNLLTFRDYLGTTIYSYFDATGNLYLNAQNDVRFADADSSNYVAMQAPTTISTNYTLTLPTSAGSNNQVLKTNGSGTLSWTSAVTSLLGGNSTTLLGSMPYQSNTDTTTLLSPNTTATRKFLRQTGTGTNGAAPVWDTLQAGDIPNLSYTTITSLRETKATPSIISNSLTLICSDGNVFVVTLNANITSINFGNTPAAGTAYGLTLMLTADGTARTITWPNNIKWAGGIAPTLTSTNGKVDVFVLITHDGGTTWYAFTSGQNL